MQYRNVSNILRNVCIPYPEGPKWFTAEPNGIIDLPEEHGFRALAHGFIKVGEEKKGSEVKDLKIIKEVPLGPIPKKKVENDLLRVRGIGKKTIEEIVEEYDSIEDIISDIKSGKFKVGGIDKRKIAAILQMFK